MSTFKRHRLSCSQACDLGGSELLPSHFSSVSVVASALLFVVPSEVTRVESILQTSDKDVMIVPHSLV